MNRFKNQEKKKAITFSYDDGITQDIRLIELLNKYNLKCTFNLNSELLGTPRILQRENLNISHYQIHPNDIRYVYDGHEVAVHTLTHPTLTMLEDAEVVRQVEQDRVILSDLVGYEVVGMAYPNGATDDRVVELIKNNTGIRYCRTAKSTLNFEPQQDLYRFTPTAHHRVERVMELGEQFLNLRADTQKLFYVWGHSFEMDYTPDAWICLEEFFKLINGKTDVFYGTNAEVLL